MVKKRLSLEQIIQSLRELEIYTSEGKIIAQTVRQIGVTEQIYYRWRKKYDGFSTGQAKRFKDMKMEISRLKHLVADLSLENAVLKDFASRNL